MRGIALLALLAGLATAPAAHAGYDYAKYTVYGNDIGGIIPWSPAVNDHFREVAASHCAIYNKVAVISSMSKQYGTYIGFRCLFPREYDPVKDAYHRSAPLYYPR